MMHVTPEATILAIEVTNRCNLSCAHCPQGKIDVPYGEMDEETGSES